MNNSEQTSLPKEATTEPKTSELSFTNPELAKTSKEIEDDYQKKRLEQWKSKRAKVQPGFYFDANKGQDNKVTIEHKFVDKNLESHQKRELFGSSMSTASGSGSSSFSSTLLNQIIFANFTANETDPHKIDAVFEALISLEPKDEIEAMIISKAITFHNQTMRFLANMANQSSYTVLEKDINIISKLTRLHHEAIDALNKHRRKGEQKFLVQYTNVENGGQAIVAGEVNGGKGSRKKSKE